MPLRDELIQRAIQQLAVSFARLLKRDEVNSPASEVERRELPDAEAQAMRAQLDELYAAFLGSSAQLIKRLGSDDLIGVLSSAGYVDGERAYLLSSLSETEAQLAVSLGAEATDDEVMSLRTRALDLMLEAGIAGLGEPDLEARVSRLLGNVPREWRSPATWERLVWFGFETGDYAAAEDALFAWLDEQQALGEDTAGVRSVGTNLYGQLAALEDEALAAGGLPRDELLEGSEELARRTA